MDFKAFQKKVQSDGAFAAQFRGKKPSEVVNLAKAAGYSITVADLKTSLSDDDLDNVAGGGCFIGRNVFVHSPN